MTVRIAESLGLKKILNLSKKLNIYDDIPELLSVSLGSAETSLLSLTSLPTHHLLTEEKKLILY